MLELLIGSVFVVASLGFAIWLSGRDADLPLAGRGGALHFCRRCGTVSGEMQCLLCKTATIPLATPVETEEA